MGRSKWRGKEATLALLKSIPVEIKQQLAMQVKAEAEDLVAQMQAVVPVDEGDLRDSIRVEATPGREMSYRVRAGGTPATTVPFWDGSPGGDLAKWIEHGHSAKDGSRVPAQPFFWPIYRLNKKKINYRLRLAARRGIQNSKG